MGKVKGVIKYIYSNGYKVFVNEEYWGNSIPREIEYYLTDENENILDETQKGEINKSFKIWDSRYGKKKVVK